MSREQPKLAGKSFVFAGFNPAWHRLDAPLEQVKAEGGEVLAEVTPTLSYLVLGPQDAGGVPRKAEQLIQKGATTQILDVGQFCGLFLSTPDEALAWLTAQPPEAREAMAAFYLGWCRGQDSNLHEV